MQVQSMKPENERSVELDISENDSDLSEDLLD